MIGYGGGKREKNNSGKMHQNPILHWQKQSLPQLKIPQSEKSNTYSKKASINRLIMRRYARPWGERLIIRRMKLCLSSFGKLSLWDMREKERVTMRPYLKWLVMNWDSSVTNEIRMSCDSHNSTWQPMSNQILMRYIIGAVICGCTDRLDTTCSSSSAWRAGSSGRLA